MRATLLLVTVLMLPAADAAAQRVTLTPSVVELRGTPGQSTTHTLTMRNDTSQTLGFDLVARDVIVEGGSRIFLPAGELPHGIAATVVFAPASVLISPKESVSVQVTVTVPVDPASRAIIALFNGSTRIGGGQARSTVSLGTLMTLTLSGDHSLAAADLVVRPQSEAENAGFELPITNDGAEPQMPKGVAVIVSDAGTMIGRASFDPRRLLPGERATFRTTYPGELAPGTYRVVSTFEYSGRSLTRTAELVVP